MVTSRAGRSRITAVVVAALLSVTLLAAGCGSSGGGTAASPSATGPATVTEQQVVDLVELTCAAIEKDAPGTFAAIDAGAAPYVDPQDPALYAFVFDRDVKLVADPDPAFQGRTMKGVPDAAGKLFRDALVAGAFADGSGWIDYVKEEPGEEGLYRKASYYQLVTGSDGEQYVVGAGRYLGPWEGTPSPSPSVTVAAPSEAAGQGVRGRGLGAGPRGGQGQGHRDVHGHERTLLPRRPLRLRLRHGRHRALPSGGARQGRRRPLGRPGPRGRLLRSRLRARGRGPRTGAG